MNARRARRPASAVALGTNTPLYRQVRDLLAQRIGAGEWRPGAPLPSELQLASQLGVSISTVRAAVAELVKARVLVRRQGKGTYISPRDEQESAYRFFHVFPNEGESHRPVSEIVRFVRGRADAREASHLGVGAGAAVIRLRNVLRMGDVAVQASDITLPQLRFPGLTQNALQQAAPTLYGAYQTLYGITVVQTEDRLTATAVPAHAASLLGQKRAAPVLCLERLARAVDGSVIETRRIWIRTDTHHLLLKQGGLD